MTHSLLAAAHGLQNKRPDYANRKVEDEYYSKNQSAFLRHRGSRDWRLKVRVIVSTLRAEFVLFVRMQPR